MSKIKLLIHEVFKQAREESDKDTKNGLASYLWLYFKEDLGFEITDKSFARYYDAYILGGKEIQIQPDRLDKMSEYVGFRNFSDFSRTFIKRDETANKTTVKINVDEDEESLTEKFSKLVINITNEQHFKMPEFVKQNGLGIIGLFLIGSVLIGNYGRLSKTKGRNDGISSLGFLMGMEPAKEKNCMYWNKTGYKLADCNDKTPRSHHLVPVDSLQLKHFKKITRKDTLTVDNALGVTWYSKFYGNVEFFTMDGKDPDNGRELRASTPYIIEKYAGISKE